MSDDLLADVLFEWNRGPYRLSTEDSLVVMARLLTLEAELTRLRHAFWHVTAGGTCPCGAWFGQEDERPHVSLARRLRSVTFMASEDRHATKATCDEAADRLEAVERALRGLIAATARLEAGDASSDVLFGVLDMRTRACTVLGIDPSTSASTTGQVEGL